jgi:hypothetical protein
VGKAERRKGEDEERGGKRRMVEAGGRKDEGVG